MNCLSRSKIATILNVSRIIYFDKLIIFDNQLQQKKAGKRWTSLTFLGFFYTYNNNMVQSKNRNAFLIDEVIK